tara:strand:- start:5841 stop:7433 length:1593 start_codon:yes stop_codon:yes gene_type:complete
MVIHKVLTARQQQQVRQMQKDLKDPVISGFQSLEYWRQRYRKKIPVWKIQEVLDSSEIKQKFSQPRHNTGKYGSIWSTGRGMVLQMDLLQFPRSWWRPNRGYKFALCVIDVYSRYAWVVPLTGKKAYSKKDFKPKKSLEDTAQLDLLEVPQAQVDIAGSGLIKIITALVRKIHKEAGVKKGANILVGIDGESALDPRTQKEGGARKLWKSLGYIKPNYNGVIVAEPGNHEKQGIVERFNRTLRDLIRKYQIATGDPRFIDQPKKGNPWDFGPLSKLVKNYNQKRHRTIKSSPYEVWTGEKPPAPRASADIPPTHMILGARQKNIYKQIRLKKPSEYNDKRKRIDDRGEPYLIEKGTIVRQKLPKSTFQKGTDPKYSTTLFEVKSWKPSGIVTLKTITSTKAKNEMKKYKLRYTVRSADLLIVAKATDDDDDEKADEEYGEDTDPQQQKFNKYVLNIPKKKSREVAQRQKNFQEFRKPPRMLTNLLDEEPPVPKIRKSRRLQKKPAEVKPKVFGKKGQKELRRSKRLRKKK